ncbi:uroporphyrinogen-III synthase [Granulicella aggregans]|uniref:Uroporphyrinogen-III synthase n=1 Tax=Granulicella aggregans TaxID=474949 RepID=A0A7W7Z982_9BACT|nr:uroporphyrinogen-III synthase [Granulicella aggregans]MBB5055689.1 uroporphyrinogen-III synthase [Granulicella aggregans]
MAHASFDGLRVLSLESRRSKEVAKLIKTYGGEAFVVPAVREVPLDTPQPVLDFAASLIAGEFDMVVFFTGVGVKAMMQIIETKYSSVEFLTALRKTRVVARGPKPQAALRELNVPSSAIAPEPSTWRELLDTIKNEFADVLPEMRVAVQEYGATNPEFLAALSEMTTQVTRVPVYQWALPENLQPLRESVLAVANAGVDVVVFMSAVQVIHLFQIAEQMGCVDDLRAGMETIVVISIGPTTTEVLLHYGVQPDFEPSRPKMGFVINEAAQYAGKVLRQKKSGVDVALATRLAGLTFSSSAAKTDQNGDGEAVAIARPVRKVAASTPTMAGFRDGLGPMDFLHEISSRIAAADSFHTVLERIVEFVTTAVPCDSCFIYVLEDQNLVLRASKNPHSEVDRVGMPIGQGITGWVAEHREPVAIAANASIDPRFKAFKNLPEDHFEAMLSTPIMTASKVVGVINLQHRLPYQHKTSEIRLLSMLGFLVGAEIERARLESENLQLASRLETRKAVDRAKGILQRDMTISEDDAYRMMQRESRQRRKSMREIAEAILLSEDLRKMRPESVAK